jgi:hypothetical protein
VRADQARHDDALAALERALATPSATREQRAAAEYQRGVIFEEHRAMTRDALASFRRSRELGGNAPDLQRRIDALASALGDVEVPSMPGAPRGGRGKNIDYV